MIPQEIRFTVKAPVHPDFLPLVRVAVKKPDGPTLAAPLRAVFWADMDLPGGWEWEGKPFAPKKRKRGRG